MRKRLDPERSVFINCPYDRDFAPIYDAIVFATVCSGFVPRSALESGSVAEPRMDRIVRALFDSCYSIHDLSRSQGEGAENLARFNMPLELGIAMALRYMSRERKPEHDWLLLVPADHRYLKFVSDLAGFDPMTHDRTVETVVPSVMAWLSSRRIGDLAAVPPPKPRDVLKALPVFQERMRQLGDDWVGVVPWNEVLIAAEENVPKL